MKFSGGATLFRTVRMASERLNRRESSGSKFSSVVANSALERRIRRLKRQFPNILSQFQTLR